MSGSEAAGKLPTNAGARRLVEDLGLETHPEGGWFRRVWTAPGSSTDDRSAGSAIEFLMEAGAGSRWHRIDASEVWTLAQGGPVVLSMSDGTAEPTEVVVGGRTGVNQAVVPPGTWQAARTTGDWSLVVCVVVPEFRYEGFELAPPGWEPGAV
ncbi:MAG: cupin domain-containing protein [Actinomycetia bacterium]|nr:cupin domain-containing protein [Actinomycetes bacterium]